MMQLSDFTEDTNQNTFYGLRDNVIEYSNDIYNPIVCSEGRETPWVLVMVASNCCYAALANSVDKNNKKKANAVLVEVDPEPCEANGNWTPGEPFKEFSHWLSVMRNPILALKAKRNIMEGEEILAYYDFKAPPQQ
jgi:hypothetical protein